MKDALRGLKSASSDFLSSEMSHMIAHEKSREDVSISCHPSHLLCNILLPSASSRGPRPTSSIVALLVTRAASLAFAQLGLLA